MKDLSHDIDNSTIDLLSNIGIFEKEQFQKKLSQCDDLTNPINRNFYERSEMLNDQINGYLTKLSNLKKIDKDFINNIKSYNIFISQLYKKYQENQKYLKPYKDKVLEYTRKFDNFFNGAIILFQCLYKMNETTRYPLKDFNYQNFIYLENEHAAKKIKRMLEDLKNSYVWIMNNYDLTRVASY